MVRRGLESAAKPPICCYHVHMNAMPMPETDLIPTDAEREAKLRAIAEGRADVAAGRVIRHDDMVKWLRSWGTPNELPPPSTWK